MNKNNMIGFLVIQSLSLFGSEKNVPIEILAKKKNLDATINNIWQSKNVDINNTEPTKINWDSQKRRDLAKKKNLEATINDIWQSKNVDINNTEPTKINWDSQKRKYYDSFISPNYSQNKKVSLSDNWINSLKERHYFDHEEYRIAIYQNRISEKLNLLNHSIWQLRVEAINKKLLNQELFATIVSDMKSILPLVPIDDPSSQQNRSLLKYLAKSLNHIVQRFSKK